MENTCRDKFKQLTKLLIEKNISITTMESCTGGVIAALITDTEGASGIFKGADITYSNEAKITRGVPENIITAYGVYSEETACAMARACLESFNADIGVGVTGTFSDPDPANAGSTPGEVFFSICLADRSGINKTGELHFISRVLKGVEGSDRHEVRMLVAEAVADELLKCLPLFVGV